MGYYNRGGNAETVTEVEIGKGRQEGELVFFRFKGQSISQVNTAVLSVAHALSLAMPELRL